MYIHQCMVMRGLLQTIPRFFVVVCTVLLGIDSRCPVPSFILADDVLKLLHRRAEPTSTNMVA